jgi:hypothetical protein
LKVLHLGDHALGLGRGGKPQPGPRRIVWAGRDMPVLQAIRERFEKEKP